MLDKLKELGIEGELAEKVIELFAQEEEKPEEKEGPEEKPEEKPEKKPEKKPEIPPMGAACELLPGKEEFAKMGYLARLELAKKNPEVYDRLRK